LVNGDYLNCERCGNYTHLPRNCSYCKKLLCRSCIKSSKRVQKIKRLIICKGCWGDLGARKKFKSV